MCSHQVLAVYTELDILIRQRCLFVIPASSFKDSLRSGLGMWKIILHALYSKLSALNL